MGPNSITCVLKRRGKLVCGRQREDSHMKMEAEGAVMCLQAKEHPGLLVTARS